MDPRLKLPLPARALLKAEIKARRALAPFAAHARLWAGLAIALLAGLALHAYQAHQRVPARVAEEAGRLEALARAVWTTTPGRDFSALDVKQAIARRQVPSGMLRPTGAPVRSAWGTPVELLPHAVVRPADGFIVRYRNLPPSACVQLLVAMGPKIYDARIDQRPVMAASGPDLSLVRPLCAAHPDRVDFIFHPDLVPGTAMPART